MEIMIKTNKIGNIAGTVEYDVDGMGIESGGSLLATGTNPRVGGTYTKFPDGTMIVNAIITDAISADGTWLSWAFPKEFVDTNYTITANGQPRKGDNTTPSYDTYYRFERNSRSYTNISVTRVGYGNINTDTYLQAIGRWK